MKERPLSALAALALTAMTLQASMPMQARAQTGTSPDTVDDLVKVRSSRFDEVYLLPGADFARYDAVIIDDPEVAFAATWLRDYNASVRGGRRLDTAQAGAILDEARTGLARIYAGAFGKAGYEVVAAPAENVLRVRVSVINLRISAPDVMAPGRVTSYSRRAGEAKIIVEARDALSGALLGRAVDARRIDDTFMRRRNSVTNRVDFERAFERWAKLSVEGIETLKTTAQPSSK